MDPLMRPTPGITMPNITAEPLGTEGELTAGPDNWNPYEDPDVDPEDYELFEGIGPAPFDEGYPVRNVQPELPRF